MAIIRLDCNLNGGDSVTPNNELFYRIYGDVDNYASPIHETGTALSDANVTVNNDNVIITGVDGTTNISFKIAAVDAAFNEGVLSDAFVESSLIFEDTFTGTVIDTAKWQVTNTNPTRIDMSQNETFIFEQLANADSAAGEDNIRSLSTIVDLSTTNVIGFMIKETENTSSFLIGIMEQSDPTNFQDAFSFITDASAVGSINSMSRESNTNDFNAFAVDCRTVGQTFKIIQTPTTIGYYNWSGSAWTQLGADYNHTSTGIWYLCAYMASKNAGTIGTQFSIDNWTVSESDYSTQFPPGV